MCRQLKSRITEHKNHIRTPLFICHKGASDSSYKKTMISIGRNTKRLGLVTILNEEPHYRKRLISEMIFIRRQTHEVKLQTDMEELPKAYFPIIDKL